MASQDMHVMPLPDELPFRPWWYHPNRLYEGKHRGVFKYTIDARGKVAGVGLPYGLRIVKLTPYVNQHGLVQGESYPIGFILPNAVTFGFSETGEFSDIKGDDKITSTRGKFDASWTLEASGLSVGAWQILTGGQWEPKTEDSQGQKARRWLRKCGTVLMSFITLGWSTRQKKTEQT